MPDVMASSQALLPLLRQFVRGDYGIALGGAHAKGAADSQSDLDLYIFAYEILPVAERAALATQFSPSIHTLTGWGNADEFVQSGTDFYDGALKVECWLRNIRHIDAVIAECQAGVIKQEMVTWTVMGFYNHCALNDLHKMQILDDPAGIIARWKAAVDMYPPLLRQNIMARHMKAAKFWQHNFHYETAVRRGDILYVSGIVQQVIHNLIQVLFALNETYFGGDKKLAAQLAHLSMKPEQFEQRITALVMPEQVVSALNQAHFGGEATVAVQLPPLSDKPMLFEQRSTSLITPDMTMLERQRDALYALVDEVDALLQRNG